MKQIWLTDEAAKWLAEQMETTYRRDSVGDDEDTRHSATVLARLADPPGGHRAVWADLVRAGLVRLVGPDMAAEVEEIVDGFADQWSGEFTPAQAADSALENALTPPALLRAKAQTTQYSGDDEGRNPQMARGDSYRCSVCSIEFGGHSVNDARDAHELELFRVGYHEPQFGVVEPELTDEQAAALVAHLTHEVDWANEPKDSPLATALAALQAAGAKPPA